MKKSLSILILLQVLAAVSYSQVAEQWAQRFTSAGYVEDRVYDMCVDASGNVYVTGVQKGVSLEREAVTIKYNSQGVQQWIQNYHAPSNNGALGYAICVDVTGNVYITGQNALNSGGANEMLVVKYSSSGTQLWSYRYQYTNLTTCAGFDIVTDATGNVYVTGQTGNNGYILIVVKFSPNGALLGQAIYPASVAGGRKIALDGAGKIIVGGWSNTGQADSIKLMALKFEQNLDFDWATSWGSRTTSDEYIDMAVDINSNVIVTGTNNLDYATVKISPAGVVQWGKTYASALGWDYCRGVATDYMGNIYVTGEIGTLGFPLTGDFCTIKYDPSGNVQWIRTLKPTINSQDGYSAYDIAVDNQANIYITGNTYGASDIMTVKYNPAGTLQWAKTYNGPSNSLDNGIGIGVDPNGNVYVAGNSFDNTSALDLVTLKYTPVPIFIRNFTRNNLGKTINDNQNTYDTISVDYSSLANYYVYDLNLTIDTVLHSSDGDLEFYLIHNGVTDTAIYRVGGTGQNFIGTVLNDSASTPISSGSAPFSGSYKPTSSLTRFNNADINGSWILKVYDRTSGNTGVLKAWSLDFVVSTNPNGVQNITGEIPKTFSLFQNYPNPFNPSTSIHFSIPSVGNGRDRSPVRLIIYDMLGRAVETLVNESLKAGIYSVDWNASKYSSGVYFYRLVTDEFADTKKMILIK